MKVVTPVAERVRSAGAASCGGVVSFTVTVWVASAELPAASVAVYVIVVVPTENTLPAGTPLRVVVTEPELSVAEALPSVASATDAAHAVAAGPVPTVTFAGAVMVGAVVSATVTRCVALAVLSEVSVTVYVRVITRGLAGEPAPPFETSSTASIAIPQLSATVAARGSAGGTRLRSW